ncbi:MAG: DegV family protein [Chloroflexota bacterium]|nr:DegV family protein [Chloroflexota bacterium]
MSKIALVTDSSQYLPQNLIDEYNIHVIPLTVIWGEETYADGVDITTKEFYTRLANTDVMPSTSQPTIPLFKELFQNLHDEGYDILAVLISEELSGTISSATQAQKLIPEANIEIINSETISMPLGFQVLAAARAIQKGASLEECKQIVEKVKEQTGVIFVVDTLEFLHRGGRIGGAKHLLGTVLQMKPILTIKDGKVDTLDQVRTQKKALAKLIAVIEERTQGHSKVHLATLHANDYETAASVLGQIKERVPSVETVYSEVSPVVGTHVGPGTVGLAYWVEK